MSEAGGEGKTREVDPRVPLAVERTLLAWIRTGLAMMGFGFVVARFSLFLRELAAAAGHTPPRSPGLSLWVGTALVLLGVAVSVLAVVGHARSMRHLRRGEFFSPGGGALAMVTGVVLAALGLALAIYLVAVAA
jgi:putative membrane protein